MATAKPSHPFHTPEDPRTASIDELHTSRDQDDSAPVSVGESYPATPVLGHRGVRQDLLRCVRHWPYSMIFSNCRAFADVLRSIEKVHVNLPVFGSLQYFKHCSTYTCSMGCSYLQYLWKPPRL